MIKTLIQILIAFYLSSKLVQAIVYVISALIAIGILMGVIYYYRSRKRKSIESLKSHLNDRELIVFNVLHKKGGSCYQSTLSFLLKMPKSSLSELLSELELRNIVIRKKIGNRNIVSIKN